MSDLLSVLIEDTLSANGVEADVGDCRCVTWRFAYCQGDHVTVERGAVQGRGFVDEIDLAPSRVVFSDGGVPTVLRPESDEILQEALDRDADWSFHRNRGCVVVESSDEHLEALARWSRNHSYEQIVALIESCVKDGESEAFRDGQRLIESDLCWALPPGEDGDAIRSVRTRRCLVEIFPHGTEDTLDWGVDGGSLSQLARDAAEGRVRLVSTLAARIRIWPEGVPDDVGEVDPEFDETDYLGSVALRPRGRDRVRLESAPLSDWFCDLHQQAQEFLRELDQQACDAKEAA